MENETIKKIIRGNLLKLQGDKTRQAFADSIGISMQTLGFWMRGDRAPSAENIVDIANACGVSADYILGINDVPSKDPDIKMIAEYTGLSVDSIDALHQISHGEGKLKPNTKALFFINAVLAFQKLNAEMIADFESGDYGPIEIVPCYLEDLYRLIFPLDEGENNTHIEAEDMCFYKADIRLYKAKRTEKELIDQLIEEYNPEYAYKRRVGKIYPATDIERLQNEYGHFV